MKKYWIHTGATPRSNAPRNGCPWNTYEEADLLDAWRLGRPVPLIAQSHERLVSAIQIRLCRLFDVQDILQVPRSRDRQIFTRDVTPGSRLNIKVTKDDMRDWMSKINSGEHGAEFKWHSQNGRATMPGAMDVDHLLNAVFDCSFRVARMRRQGIDALGGIGNSNVAPATLNAFTSVKTADVFPLYPTMVDNATWKFKRQFGHDLIKVKKAITEAWRNATPVPVKYQEAVEFLLVVNRNGESARLVTYLDTFTINSAEDLRKAAWNLRIDQPKLVQAIGTMQALSRLSFIRERFNSAMNFSPSANPDEDWDSDLMV